MTAAEDFEREALRLGRNTGPHLLQDWYLAGRLTDTDLRAVICDVWTMAEYPQAHLRLVDWVEMFRRAGFVSETGRPAPTEPMTIHRGSTWGHRRKMAWTTDESMAGWFADRWRSRGLEAMVFTVTVEPAAVLAFVDAHDGRGESEVVVDPAMLPPVRRPAES